MSEFTAREQIVETVNKLFVYTDEREWDKLQNEVFDSNIWLDMTSLGGSAEQMSAKAICDMWEAGFKELNSVNHLAGNYLVTMEGEDAAQVYAYATATHYKASAKYGTTREFVGTYDLKLIRNQHGWRINSFTYKLKYITGNPSLE